MAGVELGTAYLSLVASTSGLAPSVRKGMGQVEPEAEKGGKRIGGKFSGALKVAAVAGMAAAGAVAAKGFMDAIEREKLGDKTAAALGLSGKQAQKAGKVSASLYAGAWGGSMEEVSGAVESVMSSIDGMTKASPGELKKVTAAALDIASAFDVDVDQAATNAGVLMKTGLAKNATEAMDLITVGLQSVPKSLRGEVMDATQEYSDMFAALGFTGKESIGLLVSASENGQYGIDKMGDAIKEFTIRGTDMSKTTVDAYDAIGLNAGKMTNQLLAGGDKAQGAFQKIIDGVKGIKDPAEQSQAAIALFGTPLEDLGTKDIPKFLDSLAGAGDGMGRVKGAAKEMGDTLNDNLGTRIEGWKRSAQIFVSDGLMSMIEGFESGESSGEGFKGAMSRVGVVIKNVTTWVKDNKGVVLTLVGAWGAWKLAVLAHAGAMKLVTVATKAWAVATKVAAVAMRVLNVVMKANPIGLIITAVTLLVGALVWFFTKTKVGKKIIAVAWAGIKAAIKGVADWWTKTAWPAIKKVIDWFGQRFTDAKRVIAIAWGGIKAAAKTVWEWVRDKVFKPLAIVLLKMRQNFITAKKRVVNAWNAIKAGIKAGWEWIRDKVFSIIKTRLENLRSNFVTAKDKITGAWTTIKNKLRDGWHWIRDNVFSKLKDGVGRIKDAFVNVKNGIKNAWDKLKQIAAKPVNFILGTVYNDGIRKWWNKISGAVGLDSLSLPKASMVQFANGSEDHRAQIAPAGAMRLWAEPETGGEAYIPLASSKRGRSTAILADVANRFGYSLTQYADGGFWDKVGGAWSKTWRGAANIGKNIWNAGKMAVEIVKDPIGAIKKAVGMLAERAGAGGNSGDLFRMVGQLPGKFADGLGKKVKSLFDSGKGKGAAGHGGGLAAGKGGGDLRGNLSAMAAQARALDPTVRVTSGYRPGAITATGYRSYHGQGRAIDMVSSNMGALWDKLYAAYGKSSPELFYSGRSFSRFGTKGVPRSDHWDHVHWAMANGGILPKLYDQGGWLPTGTSVVQNNTGRPEPVFTGDQFDQMVGSNSPLIGQVIVQNEHEVFRAAEAARKREITRRRLGVRR